MDAEVRFTLKESQVRAVLRKLIRSDHSSMITDVIMGHMKQTPHGLQDLLMAINGIQRVLDFKPEDEVWISTKNLPSWEVSIPLTEAAGLVEKGFIKAKVISIDMYAYERVRVQYDGVRSSGERKLIEHWMAEDKVHSADEPILSDPHEPDLPF